MEFSFPYKTKIETLPFENLKMLTLNSLDETIDDFFAEYEKTGREDLFEDLCPYFGVIWPSAIALTKYCLQNIEHLRQKKILELGCGLALPSLVLAKHGLDISCADLHPDVAVFLHKNAQENSIQPPRLFSKDWRSWGGERFSHILASDVIYDKSQPESLLNFLNNTLDFHGEAWFADPGRPYLDLFTSLLEANGYKMEKFSLDTIHFRCLTKCKHG